MKNYLHSFVFIIFLTLSCSNSTAQKENYKWYFGNKAGLDFSTNPPTPLSNGMIYTLEGCATMNDAAGNLLFYTDGMNVYDRFHNLMASGLNGDWSSTQSALIVKQPGNASIYYIFTTNSAGVNPQFGMRYSILDMSLAAGVGSITAMNIPLFVPTTEKLTAVRHCNGTDVWVIGHEANTSVFRAYLVTSAGVSSAPQTSNVGSAHSGYFNIYIGGMKASANGKKLALAMWQNMVGGGTVEIFDFDKVTGIVSNPLTLGTQFPEAYDLEFSPDGSKLYCTTFNSAVGPDLIYQWNLCAGSNSAVINARYVMQNLPGINNAGLQLAPDGKIYVAQNKTQKLGVINNPNAKGSACNYISQALSVGTGTCMGGLQNLGSFIYGNPSPPPPFTFTSSCLSTSFSAPPQQLACAFISDPVNSVAWDFGDPASGALNSADILNPSHSFTSAGTHTVTLIRYFNCTSDTTRLPVTSVDMSVTVTSSKSFTFCKSDPGLARLTASGASTYTWLPGTVNASVAVNPSITTSYTVVAAQTGCEKTKVVTLNVMACTALHDLDGASSQAMVYPNPGDGIYTFLLEKEIKNATLTVFNAMGQQLLQQAWSGREQTLDIRFLNTGLYYYSIHAEGQRLATGKLYLDE